MTTWVEQSSGQKLNITAVESVTNLFSYSEEFDNSYWVKGNILAFGSGSVANAAIAPDGTTSMDKIVEAIGAGTAVNHGIQKALTLTAGRVYTVSWHVKAKERSTCRILIPSTGFVDSVARSATFDIASGSATTTGDGAIATIELVETDIYRISLTCTATITGSRAVSLFMGTAAYVGDDVSGMYVWGAQLEEAPLSEYVKTTTASRTCTVFTLEEDVDYGSGITDSYFINYVKDDGTLSDPIEVFWSGPNAVVTDSVITDSAEYLFFGWGDTGIDSWTDWEAV